MSSPSARPTAAAGDSSVTSTRPRPSTAPVCCRLVTRRHRAIGGLLRLVLRPFAVEVERGHALLLTVRPGRERRAVAADDERVVVAQRRVRHVVRVEDLEDVALGRDAYARAPYVARVFPRPAREEEDVATEDERRR